MSPCAANCPRGQRWHSVQPLHLKCPGLQCTGVGTGVGDAVGAGVGEGVGLGVGAGVGGGVGAGVGAGVGGAGVGAGVGEFVSHEADSSKLKRPAGQDLQWSAFAWANLPRGHVAHGWPG